MRIKVFCQKPDLFNDANFLQNDFLQNKPNKPCQSAQIGTAKLTRENVKFSKIFRGKLSRSKFPTGNTTKPTSDLGR